MLLALVAAASDMAASPLQQQQLVNQQGGNSIGFVMLSASTLTVAFNEAITSSLMGINIVIPTVQTAVLAPQLVSVIANGVALNNGQLQGWGNSLLLSYIPQFTSVQLGELGLQGNNLVHTTVIFSSGVSGDNYTLLGPGTATFLELMRSFQGGALSEAPEPASLLVVGVGLGLLWMLARRRH